MSVPIGCRRKRNCARLAVEAAIASANGTAACNIVEASDGMALGPGTVAVAFDRGSHVIVEPGAPPKLRCAVRDPVAGIRPCADLLLGSIARARLPATAGLLPGSGGDGAKGLQILTQAGSKTFVANPAGDAPADRFNAVTGLGVPAEQLDNGAMIEWVLGNSGSL